MVERLFRSVGVIVDGPRPWDPQVKDPRYFRRLLVGGTLGAGESYVDGDWECEALDALASLVVRGDAQQRFGAHLTERLEAMYARIVNRQSRARARRACRTHYDRGDSLYRAMLGPSMVYSCGYWRDANNLDQAQEAKLDLICRKLRLEAGQRVLDIGCGWGSFARFAAERYGAKVVGVTLSPSQAEWARKQTAGLPVEIRLQDYRDVSEVFDHAVSIGMFEHVGARNYATYFRRVRDCLAPDGLFLLHTIGGPRSFHATDPWIGRYIFPDSLLPSAAQITRAVEGLLVLEDWHNFGADYDRTLMAWARNFEEAWPSLRSRFDERFRRTWRYYLVTSAGTFRARRSQLWQMVFSKSGIEGGYRRFGT